MSASQRLLGRIVAALLAATIPIGIVGQSINGSVFDCSANNACEDMDLFCDAGSDCVVSCSGQNIANTCRESRIHCPDDFACSVLCDGNGACAESIIYGKLASELHVTTTADNGNLQLYASTIHCPASRTSSCSIECESRDQQCEYMTVLAEDSGSLNVSCIASKVNTPNAVCSRASIYCPSAEFENSTSCRIKGIFSDPPYTQYMQIYARYGFETVEIQGLTASDRFSDIGTMHCGNGYGIQCEIGVNACVGSGVCESPEVTVTQEPATTAFSSSISSSLVSQFSTTQTLYNETFVVIITDNDAANLTRKYENVTDVVLLILEDDTLSVTLHSEPIITDTVTIRLTATSEQRLNGSVLEKGLKEQYGDDIEVEIVKVAELEKDDDEQEGVGVVAVLSFTIIALLLVALMLTAYVCWKRRESIARREKGNDTMPGANGTQMQTLRSVSGEQHTVMAVPPDSPRSPDSASMDSPEFRPIEAVANFVRSASLVNGDERDDDLYSVPGSDYNVMDGHHTRGGTFGGDGDLQRGDGVDEDDDIYRPHAQTADGMNAQAIATRMGDDEEVCEVEVQTGDGEQ